MSVKLIPQIFAWDMIFKIGYFFFLEFVQNIIFAMSMLELKSHSMEIMT